jgi:uncharacterized protein with HEPN domain
MPPDKSDAKYLWDMLDAARAVAGFVATATVGDFHNNRMLRNAVERNLEIMGEAAGKISTELKSANPQIPWRGIIGQRNVIIHDYGEIKAEKVWLTAKNLIPALIANLEKLIPPVATE